MTEGLGKMTGLWLAAVILAVILISPGMLCSQGLQPGSRAQDGPQQVDKSFTQEQQKKRLQQLKNRKKQPAPAPKGKKSSKPTQPTDQPMRGGPVNPAGK